MSGIQSKIITERKENITHNKIINQKLRTDKDSELTHHQRKTLKLIISVSYMVNNLET